jgi:A/G-specific adenine glycosylase
MAKPFHIAPATVNAFQRALPRWYRQHRRDLPWRRTRDPYAIWVSEIMLQQTRVESVIPYYERWLKTFPTVESLARAPLSRVLTLWEGLGYYTRARNLHRAAQQVVGRGDPPGRPRPANQRTSRRLVPTCVAVLRLLPGIGRYTAGAIASIAFNRRAPIVDGNVARVFARIFAIRTNVKLPATQQKLWALAEALLPVRKCGEFNQALMELGALVCVPAKPHCDACPLRHICRAPGDALPNRGRAARPVAVVQDVAWDCRQGKVRVRQRPATGLLAGLWELPPLANATGRPLVTLRHTIMNRRITLRVFGVRQLAGAFLPDQKRQSASKLAHSKTRWFSRRQLALLPMPAAQRRAVNAIAAPGSGRGGEAGSGCR